MQYQPLPTRQSLCFQNQMINNNLTAQEEVRVEVEEVMGEEEVEEGVAMVEVAKAKKEASLLIKQYTR